MSVTININKKTMKKLEEMPDLITYAIARQILDRIGSSKIIPYKTGKMEMTMFQNGVKGSDSNYYIGNFTNYAKYVYKMPQSVNWTNPLSKAQWFDTYWKSNSQMIINNVVARYKL